jgi:hypothetical protein
MDLGKLEDILNKFWRKDVGASPFGQPSEERRRAMIILGFCALCILKRCSLHDS